MPALPSGTILLWAGSIASIPGGFVLCDGTQGTPDLRDRFIVGAGTTYNPDDSGGAVNHNHTFTGDGHFHFAQSGVDISAGTPWSQVTLSAPATGTTDNANHLPPYYALAYIMKT